MRRGQPVTIPYACLEAADAASFLRGFASRARKDNQRGRGSPSAAPAPNPRRFSLRLLPPFSAKPGLHQQMQPKAMFSRQVQKSFVAQQDYAYFICMKCRLIIIAAVAWLALPLASAADKSGTPIPRPSQDPNAECDQFASQCNKDACPADETIDHCCARSFKLKRDYCVTELQHSYDKVKRLWPVASEEIRRNCINHSGVRYDALALCVEAGLAAQPPLDAPPFHY